MNDTPPQVTPSRRQPVAGHGILSSPRPVAQLLTLLVAMVVVAVITVGAVGGFYVWNAAQSLQNNGEDIGGADDLPPISEIEGGVNLLIAGTDSCEGQDLELFPRCRNDDGGERNDVTMLVNISEEPRRVTVVSFPRDMIVPIPECVDDNGTTYPAMAGQMINTSYMEGGLACTVSTVEDLTGVDIQFAAAVRWTGVINMSDAIGGVEVCLAGPVSDSNTGLNLPAGQQTLVGVEALQFLRLRHGIGDGSDLGRISNQQQFMSSMVRKLQSDGVLGDVPTLLHFANTALSQVNTGQMVLSSSLANPTRMVQIAMAVRDVPFEDISFVQYPTEYAPGGLRVLPLTDIGDQLFELLASNQPFNITGSASSGYAVEVVEPDEGDNSTPSASPSPSADASAEPDDSVDLPSEISGTTADTQTCTVPQG